MSISNLSAGGLAYRMWLAAEEIASHRFFSASTRCESPTAGQRDLCLHPQAITVANWHFQMPNNLNLAFF